MRSIAEEPVGIRQVARRAGVSVSSVSYALSGKGTISEALRARVLQAAGELGYRPSALARGLRGARTQTIGVLWTLGGPHPAVEMARRIAMRAQAHGHVTYIIDTLSNRTVIDRALADFSQRRVDGVVLELDPGVGSDERLEGVLREFPAAVAVAGQACAMAADQIIRDRTAAVRAVIDHFIRTGRRRPAFVGPSAANPVKVHAFVSHLQGRKVSPQESVVDLGDFPTDGSWAQRCYQTLDRRFAGETQLPDALLCSTDEIAVAAMAWLRRTGRHVPEDVAVVGFNDNESSPFEHPPLASIARRDDDVADAIERLLFERLADPDRPVRQEEIPMQFIWRESAGGNTP